MRCECTRRPSCPGSSCPASASCPSAPRARVPDADDLLALKLSALSGALVALFLDWTEGKLGSDRARFVDYCTGFVLTLLGPVATLTLSASLADPTRNADRVKVARISGAGPGRRRTRPAARTTATCASAPNCARAALPLLIVGGITRRSTSSATMNGARQQQERDPGSGDGISWCRRFPREHEQPGEAGLQPGSGTGPGAD